MYTQLVCQRHPYMNSLPTLKQQRSKILLKHRPLTAIIRLGEITRVWLCVIVREREEKSFERNLLRLRHSVC